jgi:hypothetical protein
MKQVLFFTLFFILFLIPCLAQDKTVCPKIKVSASKNRYDTGDTMLFSVSITEAENNLKLEYVWKTSAGVIAKGQGTPSITIESYGLADTVVEVTVEIKGLPNNCENKFYAETAVLLPRAGEPDTIVEGYRTKNEIRAEIEALYLALRKETTFIGVIIISGTDKEVATRTAQFIKAIRFFKYYRRHVRFIRGSRKPGIKYTSYIVPKTEVDTFNPPIY